MTMSAGADAAAADRLLKKLDDANGFTTVTLRELKEVMNVGRLGKNVLADITRWLNRSGVGYFPQWVLEQNPEPRQDHELRIYRNDRASGLAALVSAVLDPSSDGDKTLAGLTGDSSTQRAEELEERLTRTKAALEDALAEINRTAD